MRTVFLFVFHFPAPHSRSALTWERLLCPSLRPSSRTSFWKQAFADAHFPNDSRVLNNALILIAICTTSSLFSMFLCLLRSCFWLLVHLSPQAITREREGIRESSESQFGALLPSLPVLSLVCFLQNQVLYELPSAYPFGFSASELLEEIPVQTIYHHVLGKCLFSILLVF